METRSQEAKKSIEAYWDKSSCDYDKQFGHGLRSEEEKELWLDLLRRNVVLPSESKVLDVGCGTGFLSLLLAELGFDVTGVDFSEEMRGEGERKAREQGLSIRFQRGDAENPDFPDNSFDAIISRHVVWTLTEPSHAMAKWRSLLRPGGMVLIVDGVWTPRSIAERMRFWLAGGVKLVKGKKRHLSWKKEYMGKMSNTLPFFGGATPERIYDVLREAGFSDISLDSMDSILSYERANSPFEYRITHGKNRRYLISAKA